MQYHVAVMIRRGFISLSLSLLMLAYVSGLAMHLHLLWEHSPAGVATHETSAKGHRCSHGHWHHEKDASPATSSTEQNSPVDSSKQSPAPADDCPTCVELAGYAAVAWVMPHCPAFDKPFSQRLAMDADLLHTIAFASYHFSRGPPAVSI